MADKRSRKSPLRLISTGLVLVLIGLVINGFDFSFFSLGGPKSMKEEVFSKNQIDEIIIDDKAGAIKIMPTKEDEIKVSYDDSKRADYRIYKTGSSLKIVREGREGFLSFMGGILGSKRPSVIIGLPLSIAPKIKINGGNNALDIAEVNLSALDIKLTNGVIRLNRLSSIDEALLKTTNGIINLDNISARNIKAETTNGIIDFKEISCTLCTTKTINGITKLSFEQINSLVSSTTNGAIELLAPKSKQSYNIEVSTKNGSSNVKNQSISSGADSLKLSSTNGRVSVEFGR